MRKNTFPYRVPLVVFITFLAVLVYFSYTGTSSDSSRLLTFESKKNDSLHVNPLRENSEFIKKDLSYVAEHLKREIEKIQSSNCSAGYNLLCGHFDKGCGLGCQLHHRAACLMMSYTMRIPLVHDAKTGWPFDAPWETVYQQLGSNCSVNENTISVQWCWKRKKPLITFRNETEIKYVLQEGIPFDEELYGILVEYHPRPFLWFVGQFIKYTIRLSDKINLSLQKNLQVFQVHDGSPFIGLHVRRTDKIREAKDSFHQIEEYIKPAEEYLRTTKQNISVPHTVYIASDDHTVLEEAQRKYSKTKLRFIGQKMNVTFKNVTERRSPVALFSAVKDLAILSRADFLVCGLSSNFCRVLFEILNADHADASDRLKNMEQQYSYMLAGHRIPEKLIPVNGSAGIQIVGPNQ